MGKDKPDYLPDWMKSGVLPAPIGVDRTGDRSVVVDIGCEQLKSAKGGDRELLAAMKTAHQQRHVGPHNRGCPCHDDMVQGAD